MHNWVAISLTAWAAVPALIYPIRYFLYSNWRASYVSIGLMVQSIVFATVLLYTLLLRVFPDLPGRGIFSVGIYFAIGAVYWSQLVIMVRAQTVQSSKQYFGRRSDDVTRKERHNGRRSENLQP